MAETAYDILQEPGETRFWYSLLAALLIEAGVIAALVFSPVTPPPRVVKAATMAIHMIQPIAPPKALPLPPKLIRPPPPPPPVPVPTLPKPPPPLPDHPHIQILRPPPPKPVHRVNPRVVHRAVVRPPPPQLAPVAPPAPQITAPPPSPAQVQSAEARYVGIVRSIILGNLTVPAALRNLGASGIAMVEFKVAADGRIIWVRVIRRSAYRAADRAARAAVTGSRFPGFLPKMPAHPMVFEIPIHVSGAG